MMTEERFDFRPLGCALKHAREAKGLTREQLSEQLDIAPRHIQAIENEGQLPSLRLLVRMARLLGVSLDAYVLDGTPAAESPTRRRVVQQLDALDEAELAALEAALDALRRSRTAQKRGTRE